MKITTEYKKEIAAYALNNNATQAQLAEKFNVSRSTVARAIKNFSEEVKAEQVKAQEVARLDQANAVKAKGSATARGYQGSTGRVAMAREIAADTNLSLNEKVEKLLTESNKNSVKQITKSSARALIYNARKRAERLAQA